MAAPYVYSVDVNGKTYKVSADTNVDAINLALTQYQTDLAAEPNNCETSDTDGICACATYVAEEVLVAP